jgi:hypothetical protein
MKIKHSNLFFNVHDKKIRKKIQPKMIMMWTYENMVHLGHSKVHNSFGQLCFNNFFCTYVFFVLTYHILSPCNIFQIKFIHQNACI